MKVITQDLGYPEGPIAMPDGSVLVLDIYDEALKRVSPSGQVTRIAALPGGPNGAALGPEGAVFVCNNGGTDWIDTGPGTRRTGPQSAGYRGGSIERVDLVTGRVETLYDAFEGVGLRSPNDLVFDGTGGFYFTDFGKRRAHEMDLGAVYWAKADGSEIRLLVSGMISPNGIALSPDGNSLYVAETYTGRIWMWSIEAPGQLRKADWPASYGATLFASPGGIARFDGLAVAASGAVYAAALDMCAVLEFQGPLQAPRLHPLPDLLVTNLCFGGPDMRTCYATLSHDARLVRFRVAEPGLVLHHAG
ncbi:SMP-30/gluconolactonase/LRE family protein [Xinfangfangia sp. CPCC 101601]|uniref:SMP-30/gluconolactonase/LRE family protein n=1 Tax=Pseudogemmobacter lacusdianii TaxID=3069608 RepID=A0ABU0VYS4_9RHOB|nr:SMP-30/gluconolactonase/LRE family protein [Xinfangfangia sp. CPCC 101601]MDQ2066045.1 SMP-30/gluconolactonase/LRE family protein [Xinfangfangia sp. CPCC 101601]